eukprot:6569576-Karenia_brevis.AAC.1
MDRRHTKAHRQTKQLSQPRQYRQSKHNNQSENELDGVGKRRCLLDSIGGSLRHGQDAVSRAPWQPTPPAP